MPTLYIIDKNVQEKKPWLLKLLPLQASDYLLLTERTKDASTLYPIELHPETPHLIFAKPSFIYHADEMAQDYLSHARHTTIPGYLDIPSRQLQDEDLAERLSLYVEPYPRPSRLYVAHVAPLNTTRFQEDDFILTMRSPMHPAQLTRIKYNATHDAHQYAENLYIQKTRIDGHTVLKNEALQQKLDTILDRGTIANPAFIDATSTHYHCLLQDIREPMPRRTSLIQPKLSTSSMGIGLKHNASDSPTDVTAPLSPQLGNY
jgi:hypothetical protein